MENEIKYIEQRSQAIAKYSDKLRQSIKAIDLVMTPDFEAAGVKVKDDEFVYKDANGTTYNLSITKEYKGNWGIFLDGGYYEDMIWIGDASRAALKMAVKRIIPLLEKYSRVLEQNELKFKKIAEDAEKMAESIRGN